MNWPNIVDMMDISIYNIYIYIYMDMKLKGHLLIANFHRFSLQVASSTLQSGGSRFGSHHRHARHGCSSPWRHRFTPFGPKDAVNSILNHGRYIDILGVFDFRGNLPETMAGKGGCKGGKTPCDRDCDFRYSDMGCKSCWLDPHKRCKSDPVIIFIRLYATATSNTELEPGQYLKYFRSRNFRCRNWQVANPSDFRVSPQWATQTKHLRWHVESQRQCTGILQ